MKYKKPITKLFLSLGGVATITAPIAAATSYQSNSVIKIERENFSPTGYSLTIAGVINLIKDFQEANLLKTININKLTSALVNNVEATSKLINIVEQFNHTLMLRVNWATIAGLAMSASSLIISIVTAIHNW